MTKVSIAIFLPLIWVTQALFSQTTRVPVSAGYLGLGAYSKTHIDVFSFQANQAALAGLNHMTAGIYGEERFLVKQLGFYNAAVVLPTPSGNFGIDTRYFGFADYNETQLGLAYGRSLGKKIDVGVEFNYYVIRVAGYGNASAFNFEIGTVFHLTDKLNAGLHVFNPLGGTMGKNEEEKLPSVFCTGLGFEASQRFFMSAEIQKEEDQPVNVNAALQYKFVEQLMARIGVSSCTSSIYFGVGITFKSFRVDATASYHQQLGITPGLLIAVFMRAKEKAETENK